MADNQSIFGNLVYAHSSQANWEQTDELAFDYIKNKPTDLATITYVDEKNTAQDAVIAQKADVGDDGKLLSSQLPEIATVTATSNGLMESTDKVKLDAYAPQAIVISTSTSNLPEVVNGAILIAFDA